MFDCESSGDGWEGVDDVNMLVGRVTYMLFDQHLFLPSMAKQTGRRKTGGALIFYLHRHAVRWQGEKSSYAKEERHIVACSLICAGGRRRLARHERRPGGRNFLCHLRSHEFQKAVEMWSRLREQRSLVTCSLTDVAKAALIGCTSALECVRFKKHARHATTGLRYRDMRSLISEYEVS